MPLTQMSAWNSLGTVLRTHSEAVLCEFLAHSEPSPVIEFTLSESRKETEAADFRFLFLSFGGTDQRPVPLILVPLDLGEVIPLV